MPLAVVPLERARDEANENEGRVRPVRELPTQVSPRDPRTDPSAVPPLELETDLTR